jgi:hypothetical protein
LKELQDVAKAWAIYNNYMSVVQSTMVLDCDSMRYMIPPFCAYNVQKSDSFLHFTFQNDTLSRFAKSFVSATRDYLYYMQVLTKCNSQTDAAMVKSSAEMDTLMPYAMKRYALSRFTSLREASYDRLIDKKQYRTYPGIQKIEALKKTDWREAAKLIAHAAAACSNPNQRAIAWMDYADLYETHRLDFVNYEDTVALSVYYRLAVQPEYHLYKFEAWRKWRCLYQLQYCGAKLKDPINNKIYDSIRFISMKHIYNHLEDEPMDSMAINEYFQMATHPGLFRFGSRIPGNKVLDDYAIVFDFVSLRRPTVDLTEEEGVEKKVDATKGNSSKRAHK